MRSYRNIFVLEYDELHSQMRDGIFVTKQVLDTV